jgi:hypothetical protein
MSDDELDNSMLDLTGPATGHPNDPRAPLLPGDFAACDVCGRWCRPNEICKIAGTCLRICEKCNYESED